MVEASKCMFFSLLEEADDDLDRAILQPQEDHRAHATENRRRCSRTKTSSGSPCSLAEAATELPSSHFETEIEVIRSCSETITPSSELLECVVSGDCHSNSCYP